MGKFLVFLSDPAEIWFKTLTYIMLVSVTNSYHQTFLTNYMIVCYMKCTIQTLHADALGKRVCNQTKLGHSDFDL